MAISKILNMKDCGGHFHGKHLKRSLDYVMNPEKTQDGRLVGAINCQVDSAFEQMKATKRKFGKVDKRQGYHIILSFKEDEVNSDTAFEITRRFVEEYLGKSYEAVYVVHDNTAHVHSHIVFNSVSFWMGKSTAMKRETGQSISSQSRISCVRNMVFQSLMLMMAIRKKSMKAIRTGANIVKAVLCGQI